MKSNKPAPTRTPVSTTKKGTSPLNLSPEQAQREAGKLNELNADLENRKTVADTSARTSPLGRAE